MNSAKIKTRLTDFTICNYATRRLSNDPTIYVRVFCLEFTPTNPKSLSRYGKIKAVIPFTEETQFYFLERISQYVSFLLADSASFMPWIEIELTKRKYQEKFIWDFRKITDIQI
jgi:hypothetical protein